MSDKYSILIPDLQVSFYYRLKTIRDLFLYNSLISTIKHLHISEIDKELGTYALKFI